MNILGIGKKEKNMGKEYINLQMVIYMMGIGKKEKEKEKENFIFMIVK